MCVTAKPSRSPQLSPTLEGQASSSVKVTSRLPSRLPWKASHSSALAVWLLRRREGGRRPTQDPDAVSHCVLPALATRRDADTANVCASACMLLPGGVRRGHALRGPPLECAIFAAGASDALAVCLAAVLGSGPRDPETPTHASAISPLGTAPRPAAHFSRVLRIL